MQAKPTLDVSPRRVALSYNLELRLAPVLEPTHGMVNGIDFRLYRRYRHTEEEGSFASTSAGFRVGLGALRALSRALDALANDLGL